MHLARPLKYRSDIDGLRAVAILGVVLYHFGANFIPGGFTGVDVFFVISGFLITRIIHDEMHNNSFGFAQFYERRIRRLFPALFVMLTVVLLVAWLLFLPSDVNVSAKSVVATVIFSSNIYFWRNSGYFAPEADLNPLLHTWSLAVEEQFYLLFPVLLVLSIRYFAARLNMLVWSAVLLSLAACVVLQQGHSTATFFLAPFRAWELGLGCLLALNAIPSIKTSMQSEVVAAIGFLLVIIAMLLIPESENFPGWQAIIPVLGTAMILHSGRDSVTFVSRSLSWKPLVFIGLLSYSWYLWHWPVFVFASYANALQPLGWITAPLVFLSLAIAYASYRWIEQPFRRKTFRVMNERRNLFISTAVAIGFLTVLSAVLAFSGEFGRHYQKSVLAADDLRNPVIPYLTCIGSPELKVKSSACLFGDQGAKPEMLLWGDSFALALAPAFHKALLRRNSSGIVLPNNACPPLLEVDSSHNSQCRISNDFIFRWLAKNPSIKTVVLHAAWPEYVNPQGRFELTDNNAISSDSIVFTPSFLGTVLKLSELGLTVVIVGPIPASPATPTDIAIRRHMEIDLPQPIALSNYEKDVSEFNVAIALVSSKYKIIYLDPSEVFCKKAVCKYLDNDLLLYRDNGHLSIHGANYLAEWLSFELQKMRKMEDAK